ncbi:MAG TPA: hypothetical protein VEH29_07690 [Acidimicrobiales bacterium]|nr:hypothetical protein [Acidimicrobiales bacterium]
MGLLGGPPPDGGAGLEPFVRSTRNPPKVWATTGIEGDTLVIRLTGWRMVFALQRGVRVPLSCVIGATHDPAAYQHVSRRLRQPRRARTTLFKLGSQHGRDGWSFWACGFARNAVVVETTGFRYRYLILEVEDPKSVAAAIAKAAGLEPPPPPAPPAVRSLTDARRLHRQPTGPPAGAGRRSAQEKAGEKQSGASDDGPRP